MKLRYDVVGAAAFLVVVFATSAFATPFATPMQGAFASDLELPVAGAIPTADPTGTDAQLNGSSLALVPGVLGDGTVAGLFDVLVPLDFVNVFNPLLLEWTLPDGGSHRERRTVVAGFSTDDGDFSLESAALHFTERGLDAFEPALEGLVGFDLEALLPVGRRIYNKCLVDTFAGCIGRAKVYIDDPAPRFASQQVTLDAFVDGVQLDLVLREVRVDLEIRGSGVVPDCRLRLTADAAQIGGRYALGPDPDAPTHLDLGQAGTLSLGFDRFRQNFTGGSCNDGLIEDVVDDIVGDLEDDILDALEELLEDPDGIGPEDGPLTDVVEDALADVEITGPIAAALEVGLDSPVARVRQSDDGVTLITDNAVLALPVAGAGAGAAPGGCDAPLGAPDLSGSYEPTAPLPALGVTTPVGDHPFDVALALNDAVLGQGLKALTECGLLHSDLEELSLAGTRLSITAQLLSAIEPAFGDLPADLPLTIRVRPKLAPILGEGPGPMGELASLQIADLRVDVVDPASGVLWLELVVDATTGLDVDFDPVGGELALGTAGALSDVEVVVLGNAIGADEVSLAAALGDLLETGTLSLADELGSFRVPGFLGLELIPIEIGRAQGSATFFFAAVPVPEPSVAGLAAAALLAVAAVDRQGRCRKRRRRRSGS